MIKLLIGNIKIKLQFEQMNQRTIDYTMHKLHLALDPLDPERYRKRPYNLRDKHGHRVWDGRVKIIDQKHGLLPTGLYPELIKELDHLGPTLGITYDVVDKRPPALKANIPDKIFLDGHGKEKDIILRDYQYNSVKQAFKQQSGILLEATNSGKTSLAITIFKYLLPTLKDKQKLLFIAPNASIMNQVYAKFQHYIGENSIGIWGDGKLNLKPPIICATIQTLASGIKKPKTKLTHKKDKLVERIATRYVPAIMQGTTPKANLDLLARNFKPRFKYEKDDLELIRSLDLNLKTDKDVIGCCKSYVKKYQKLLYDLNAKGYQKYNSTVRTLQNVVAVICDEAQDVGSDSYWKVFQYLINARMRLGMTGTLDKTKKIHMAKITSLLGHPIARVTNQQMIQRGISAKPHIRTIPIDEPRNLEAMVGAKEQKANLSNSIAGDLVHYQDLYDLGVVHNDYRNQLVAKLAVSCAKRLDKQAVLIIVNSIEHGELIAKEIEKLKAPYAFLQGKDTTEQREKVFDAIKSGQLKILIGTKIMDAGIDIPNLRVFIECAAGKSYITLLQRIGRMLRTMPNKQDVIIFDFYDETADLLNKHARERIKYYKQEGFEVK